MAKKRRSKKNPGNVFLGDDQPSGAVSFKKTFASDWIPLIAVGGALVAANSLKKEKAQSVAISNEAKPAENFFETVEKTKIPSADELKAREDLYQKQQQMFAPSLTAITEQIDAAKDLASQIVAQGLLDRQMAQRVAPVIINSRSQWQPNYRTVNQAPRVSLLEAPKVARSGGGGGSSITGGSTNMRLASGGPSRKIDRVRFNGYGDVEDVVSTGAQAIQALQEASSESSDYLQQAVVHPEQIAENTKKMSLLGLALTLYSLHWAYKLVSR